MKKMINRLSLWMALFAIGFTSCTDDDLVQASSGRVGELHISSVNVGENKVASRAETEIGYNTVISEVNKLYLTYQFGYGAQQTAEASNTSGTWDITVGENNSLKPSENETWNGLNLKATNLEEENESAESVTDIDGITMFSTEDNTPSVRIYRDLLEARTGENNSIVVGTGATLGQLTITLSHAHALLSLSQENVNIEPIIKEGEKLVFAENNKGLATLWIELNKDSETIYVPFTLVEENWQAIVPANYTIQSFKAVMALKADDAAPGSETKYYTIGLSHNANNNFVLTANYKYNLELYLGRKQEVVFNQTDKPGWEEDIKLESLQQQINNQLKYKKKQFEVSGPTGLHYLNQWLTGTGGETEISKIEGYGNMEKTASRLSHDIQISGTIDYSDEKYKIYDLDGEEGKNQSNWIPLGTADEPYTGTITATDGAQITGLEIHVNEAQKGFVGYLGEDGKVERLVLGGNFSTRKDRFGAVVGFNDGGTVSKCETTSETTVSCSEKISYIGGVVGWNNTGLVEKCINNATVTATNCNMVGGVLGENYRLDNCVIKDCTNKGNITGYKHVGGVVGINHRVVNNCHNEGSVTGNNSVGGVVGMSNDADPAPSSGNPGWPIYVINATNEGQVTGITHVGGVVGDNGSTTFEENQPDTSSGTSGGYIIACWNSGVIAMSNVEVVEQTENSTYFGGVVGVNHAYSYDSKEYTDAQKEILGNRTSHIIACYNVGTINISESNVTIGGIVGLNKTSANVWACYYTKPDKDNKGCGDENNTNNTVGKGYSYLSGSNWEDENTDETPIKLMNNAISSYKADANKNSQYTYGIIESPTNYRQITTEVKIYSSTNGNNPTLVKSEQ